MIFFFGASKGRVSFVNNAPSFGDVELNAAKVAVELDGSFAIFGFGIFKVGFDRAEVAVKTGGVEFVFEIFDCSAKIGVGILAVREEFFAEDDMKGNGEQGGSDEKVADG